MPLTTFQAEVLRVIAANRCVESHIAGGIALNSNPESPRISGDIDIFHDATEAIEVASEADCACLLAAGYSADRLMWNDTFRRVRVLRGSEFVKLEWAQDSAWRFFPIERHPVLAWKLHRFDALTNKALAMGSRSETRDLVDLVMNHELTPLYSIVWAACSKDPGFTPGLLLEQMRRNARIELLAMEEMGLSMQPSELKSKWLEIARETEAAILAAGHAGVEPGVVFLAPDGSVKWFDTPGATIHRATLGGVIPRLGGVYY